MSDTKKAIEHFYDDYVDLLEENRYGDQKLSMPHFHALFSIFEDMHSYRKVNNLYKEIEASEFTWNASCAGAEDLKQSVELLTKLVLDKLECPPEGSKSS